MTCVFQCLCLEIMWPFSIYDTQNAQRDICIRFILLINNMSTIFLSCSLEGPVLHAEVGDILLVTFLNNGDRSYSIQPHGLQYMKEFEGAQYEDGEREIIQIILLTLLS